MAKIDDGNIFEFLNGSKSFAGVWFGDDHPLGQFWWRRHLTEALAERDFRIKRLEREKNDVAIELHDAIMREVRTYRELSRIKDGVDGLTPHYLNNGVDFHRGGLPDTDYFYRKSDLDRLMKGGE